MGLDPLAREVVWEHLRGLRTAIGTTIVLTTHYMDEAEELCARLAIMHQGKIAIIGTPSELKASIEGENVTMDDVFVHYAGGILESEGNYRETARTRRTVRRLG